MRGVLAIALVATGTVLPVSADIGSRGSERYVPETLVIERAGANLLDSLALPEPAAWVITLGGFAVAGMVQRGRRIATEFA